jgi:hypothetical protein
MESGSIDAIGTLPQRAPRSPMKHRGPRMKLPFRRALRSSRLHASAANGHDRGRVHCLFGDIAMNDMNLALAGAIIFVVILMAVGWVRRDRAFKAKRQTEMDMLPKRVTNPKDHKDLRTLKIWELKTDDTPTKCTWAREWSNRRFPTNDAIPLPAVGCTQDCRCKYKPVPDTRHRKRRDGGAEGGLDFNASGDRRARGRRKEDSWGNK